MIKISIIRLIDFLQTIRSYNQKTQVDRNNINNLLEIILVLNVDQAEIPFF